MNHPDREAQVSRAFVALADTLVEDYDVIDLLDKLAGYSADLLAAHAAAVLLADPRDQLQSVAASSEDASVMELLALDADDSPCVECYRTVMPVRVPDLERARAWRPRFVAAVDGAGAFRSVHALPLRLRGHAIGVLTLLHTDPGRLPEDDLALGQALADVATIGVLSERAVRHGEVVTEQLQTALNSRVLIEQAKGVIAQRVGLSMDEAFTLLRDHSRHHNLRLTELARQIVARELDPSMLAVSTVRASKHLAQ